MSFSIATLMCHAPIVVPAVGRDRGADCATTTAAMRAVARRMVDAHPDVVVVLSPHTPRAHGAWSILEGDVVGDFGPFGAPDARVALPAAPEARAAIHRAARERGVATVSLARRPLDHGAGVPLWFVQEAGWRGPTVVIGLPWEEEGEASMGAALAAAAAASGQRWALLASGDMSHRLTPGAPSGYDPRARLFDTAFVERLRAGDLRGARTVDPELRALAGEDVSTSVAVAAHAVGLRSDHHEVLAYEGPFGVGYCEAVLYSEAPGA